MEDRETHLSVRLDARTAAELKALVDYFADNLGSSNPSQVARTAIHRLYEVTPLEKKP